MKFPVRPPILISAVPVFAAAVLVLFVCFACSGCYTLKQGSAMLGYLNKARPLKSMLEATDAGSSNDLDKNRLFAERVEDIRNFAMNDLGLAMSKNYTGYVEIDRDYLAAVVSACASDSFTRYEWNYPVVGKMPYKGFFNVDDARKERIKLEKKGLDVWVRPVDAFSTLGFFKDPLYSYMQNYSTGYLANLIIHELTHATVFIKGQVQFNEELAEFIGTEGSRLYIASRFGQESAEYQALFTDDADNAAYVAFIQEIAVELDAMYKGNASREEKLAAKEKIIADAKDRFEREYARLFTSERFRGFVELPVNNAYFELYRLYYAGDNFFADLYEKQGRDLPAFIVAAKTIAKQGSVAKRQPRAQLEKNLGL